MPISPSRRPWSWCLVGLLAAATISSRTSLQAAGDAAAYPVPVPGFVAPQAGEHPRMLFRKADIAALKKKADTEDGKKIIAQLKITLGGGDGMPELFANDPPVNSVSEAAVNKHPEGTYTLSHSVGFAFLYTLTGERKYQVLARECLDKLLEGQVDRDSRYNYTTPGTGFRLGFVYQSIALTYDMCYDAWPESYRKSIVEKCQTFVPKKVDKGGKPYDLETLAGGGGYPPGSNHYGGFIQGPAMLAMAFKGDPGADGPRLQKLLAETEKSLHKQIGEGFGDMGWFAEGTSCGRVSSNTGLLPMIQSLKVAEGKDYINPTPGPRYIVMRLMHEIVSNGTKPRIPHRGDYGDNNFYSRNIISHMGDFAQGMGAVKPEEAEAMKWIYDTFVEAGGNKTYNASFYPHLAVYSFVNWPAKATDPDDVLPHVIADNVHGYYVARNRWQDANDVIVTTNLKRGPGGYKGGAVKRGTDAWGMGETLSFGSLAGKTAHYRPGKDGSMELADEAGNALVVDFSRAGGAEAVLACTGTVKATSGKKSKITELSVGGVTVSVLTFSSAEQPTPTVNGDAIAIGKQTIKVEKGKLTLGQFTAAK